jgi:hypothetical protein
MPKHTGEGEMKMQNQTAAIHTIFGQTLEALRGNPDFARALDGESLTPEAAEAIGKAFDAVADHNQRLAAIFLEDKTEREHMTRFWFARSYAAVHAESAYRAAFTKASA